MKIQKPSLVSSLAKVFLGLAACSAVTVAVYAAVVFDPSTGTGFVGKGDVQSAFGWNNQQLQQNAGGISFSTLTTSVLVQNCVDNVGRGQTVVVGLRHRSTVLGTNVAYNARRNSNGKNGDITGFYLTGYTGTTQVVDQQTGGWVGPNGETTGNACPGDSHPQGAPWELAGSGGAGELYVNYGDGSVCVWEPTI